MLGKPRIFSRFPPTHLINSEKHEHSCKTLYLPSRITERLLSGRQESNQTKQRPTIYETGLEGIMFLSASVVCS